MINQPNNNNGDNYSGMAASADATVIALGLTIVMEGEENEAIGSSNKGDNITMQLPENQIQYLRKMRGSHNKPLIVVVFAGCPLDLTEVSKLADAVIYAWYPGEQGGNAIADIIFGDVSPSGKLPITFPKNKEQLPAYEDYSMKDRTYKYMTQEPLYPFGYGLTYSKLNITDLSVDVENVQESKSQIVEATVVNEGNHTIEDVIQLYVSLKNNRSGVPLASLKDFKRIRLEPKQSLKVSFVVAPDVYNYIDTNGNVKRHKGDAEIIIGNASPGTRSEALGAALHSITVNVK
jgi:beta-glucosidase